MSEEDDRDRDIEQKKAQTRGLRHNLYEHVTLSVRAVDAIIAVCVILIIAFIIIGTLKHS